MALLETDTLSNQDISSALEIGSYTADAARHIYARVFADQVAGSDDYVVYMTVQLAGAGSAYKSQVTTESVGAVTAIAFQSITLPVSNTDVVKVYLTGAAGDTTTVDTRVEWWEDPAARLDVATTGEAGLDFNNIKDASALHTLTNISIGGDIEGDVSGNVGGDMLGDVVGNVEGYVNQVNVINTNAINADALAASAVTEIQSGLATLANQTTILARIGAFTGTGVNTILGFLKALASKAATLPSDIGGTFSPVTDSVEALRDYMASSASITPVTYIDGDTINIIRGDVFAESMDDTGVTDDFVTVDFSVKRRESDSDDNAIIRIRKNASGLNDGLTRLNGAAVSAGDASLASLSISGGTVTWSIDESVTDDLIIADGLVYDIQEIDADGPHTRVEGTCNIKADVTRLIV